MDGDRSAPDYDPQRDPYNPLSPVSARGYHCMLRVARTLADLDGADKVGRVHLAEALSYRALADEVRRAA